MVAHNGTRLFKLYISSRAEPHKAREAPTTTAIFFARTVYRSAARQLQTQIYTKYMEGLRAVRLRMFFRAPKGGIKKNIIQKNTQGLQPPLRQPKSAALAAPCPLSGKFVRDFFFSRNFIRVNSIHTGRQGGEANRLTNMLASTRADYAPR